MRVESQETDRKSHKYEFEFGGGRERQTAQVYEKEKHHRLVSGTLTTVLDFERELHLHLHRSKFPFFGKLALWSSGCKPKHKRASVQNWHKAAERQHSSNPVQSLGIS